VEFELIETWLNLRDYSCSEAKRGGSCVFARVYRTHVRDAAGRLRDHVRKVISRGKEKGAGEM